VRKFKKIIPVMYPAVIMMIVPAGSTRCEIRECAEKLDVIDDIIRAG
jgi:hypothetical protein